MKQTKIETVSRGFKYLFMGLLALWVPLHLIIYFGYDGAISGNGFSIITFKGQQLIDFAKLTSSQKILAFLVNGLTHAFSLIILYKLVRLFQLFEKGVYFTAHNIKNLKHIGLAMVVAIIVDPFHQLLVTATLSIMANPPGQRAMGISVGNTEAYWIVTAVMIYLIAWIMDEGRKLQDEAQHTV